MFNLLDVSAGPIIMVFGGIIVGIIIGVALIVYFSVLVIRKIKRNQDRE